MENFRKRLMLAVEEVRTNELQEYKEAVKILQTTASILEASLHTQGATEATVRFEQSLSSEEGGMSYSLRVRAPQVDPFSLMLVSLKLNTGYPVVVQSSQCVDYVCKTQSKLESTLVSIVEDRPFRQRMAQLVCFLDVMQGKKSK
jgi:hypothetical protein